MSDLRTLAECYLNREQELLELDANEPVGLADLALWPHDLQQEWIAWAADWRPLAAEIQALAHELFTVCGLDSDHPDHVRPAAQHILKKGNPT